MTLMIKSTNHTIDHQDSDLISAIDDLPLWSAPFGLKLLDTVRYGPGMNVLDIGCGLGFPLLELAQRLGTASKLYGIDPWEAALKRVKFKSRKLGLTNVTLIKGKAEELPFDDGFFDLIVSNNGLNNVENIEASLSECRRVCRTGGQMVVTMNLPDTMREFYDTYRKVLSDLGRTREIGKIEEHIHSKRKPLNETKNQLANSGFAVSNIKQGTFTMRFTDGTAMLNHFLIRLAFLRPWKDILAESDVPMVFTMIEERLNALSGERGGLVLTIPYACVDCRKR